MRIIDSHTHIDSGRQAELIREARTYGYEKIGVMGIPCCGNVRQNLDCIDTKRIAPGFTYVYGGMVYSPDLPCDRQTHEKQLRLMWEAGFDGWKILESKPSVYKRLRLPLDSDVFEGAFAFAEEAGIPITWHAGDPATFWSEETAPEFAVRNRWLCTGEGIPPLNEIYRQVETVLERHPGLKVTLAHMYFTTDDPDHARRLLDTYGNLRLDLTPGSEMYSDFMADPEYWTAFITEYQDRLIYGSDMTGDPDDIVFGSQREITGLVMKTLTRGDSFSVKWIKGKGLNLPAPVIDKIFCDNYLKIVGGSPKPVNEPALERYARFIIND